MPEVLRFRSTWGVEPGENYENYVEWGASLKAQGYAGIEININGPDGKQFWPNLPQLRQVCDDIGLEIIPLINSHWPHALGPRPQGLRPQDHLEFYRNQLEKAKELRPFKINAHSGADYWSWEQSVEFYKGTLAVDAELGLAGKVVHETHRNRSLFTPYATAHIVSQVPELRITGDFSHHVVCCERLLDISEEDRELLKAMIPHVSHIHTRIGTTQGSQCPDPSDPVFADERKFFDTLWTQIAADWEKNNPNGAPITFVPEYGPYPYHQYNAKRDFKEVCNTEGARVHKLFEETLKA